MMACVQAIFWTQYFNIAIVLMFGYANLEKAPVFVSWLPLRTTFIDFSPEWYSQVGDTIILTMFYSAFIPFLKALMKICF